ncbi:GerAB/ArcD/ProY family transporter [Mycoplasmatota bacterium]|nr:GerAB/ArcD/ProY family transporter [Mycoplasmatota bacterium]
MLKSEGKISVKQLMIIFIIAVYTPSARFLPTYVAGEAKQAAWLSPVITLIIFLAIVYASSKLFKKYNTQSYAEILNDITSRFIGKVIVLLYIIWVTYLLVWYVRFYGETLVTLVYPNVDINIFLIVILYLVSITIKSGVVIIARMSETIFLIVTISITVIIALMIPDIKIGNITPISTLDVVPIFKGSIGSTSLICLPCLFFFSHEWTKKNEFLIQGFKAGFYIFVLETLIILACIGKLGHTIISNSSLSFWISVKNVELLGFLSGMESLLLSAWLLTDFVIITILTYSALNMFKSLFNLKDYKPFINIHLVIIYLISWIVAKNIWELGELGSAIGVYMDFFLATLPIFIFLVGRIRKKI